MKIVLAILFLLLITTISAQKKPVTNQIWLLSKSEQLKLNSQSDKEYADRLASKLNMPIRVENDSITFELISIKNLKPHYYKTTNLNAAKTISTDLLWNGGSLGLNLDGTGVHIAKWDGGVALATHQEFGNRIKIKENNPSISNHGTHVAGTIIASGVNTSAKGMAPNANLDSYDWTDDEAEMAAAAAQGLRISNHSYGFITGWEYDLFDDGLWAWFGAISISQTEDYSFGFYSIYTKEIDEIAYNAPNYLIVKSAGNDRNDDGPALGEQHWYWDNGWKVSSATREPDGQYDCLSTKSIAKNILTVAAVNDVPNGYQSPGDVTMSTFSSWGPVDDGRIKPDISANGVQLLSANSSSANDYGVSSGTSMAAPSVAGSLTLLQQHSNNLYENYLTAASLKALVINTADEAGTFLGPDYVFGWGLINTAAAAELISTDQLFDNSIIEESLINNGTYEFTFYNDGTQAINVTAAWTDPAGTPVSEALNPRDIMLVNDLDLRVTDEQGTIYLPWKLDPYNPANAATKSDNIVDNIEKITIENPTAGFYTVSISHKGILQNPPQSFSVVTSKISEAPIIPVLEVLTPNGGEVWQVGSIQQISWEATAVESINLYYSLDNRTTWNNIILSTPADAGFYNWIIPNTPSSEVFIKIEDASNSELNDISDDFFRIREIPALSLFKPNGGEKWRVGTIQQITWTSTEIEQIRIEYSVDGGNNYILINNFVDANSGSKNWVIPDSPSKACVIKITDKKNLTLFDISDYTFEIASQPDVTITSPNGGEKWNIGTIQKITWNAIEVEQIKIEYSIDAGNNYSIITNLADANLGSFEWIIPDKTSKNCLIKITDINAPSIFDVNDNLFEIAPPPALAIISPVEGEKWTVGTEQTIRWNSLGINNILIEYSIDDGLTWITVSYSVEAELGNYNWVIPDTPSPSCTIKVTDTDESETFDISENFTIASVPILLLTAPKGGENWQIGSSQNITWNSVEVDFIGIDLSIDNGTSWVSLFESISAEEEKIDWQIPNSPSEDCLIKIYDLSNDELFSISQQSFTISELPEINVLSPNGGEELAANNVFEIVWEYTEVQSMNISYSMDGTNWVTIADGVDASLEKLEWIVPEISTETASIRVSDSENIEVFDISDNPFRIKFPQITIISPNGGEEFIARTIQSIMWSCSDIESIDLFYSTDNAINWESIELAITDLDENYNWLTPDIISDQFLIKAIDNSNPAIFDESDNVFSIIEDPVSIRDESSIPKEYLLFNNYPNPFNPTTSIKFALPEPARVELAVYNIIGEKLLTLVESDYSSGYHTVIFHASNFTSGIYYYMFRAGNKKIVKTMMLVK